MPVFGILNAPMDGARAKVVRSWAHIESLKAELWVWRYLQRVPPYTTTKKFEPEHNRFVFRIETVVRLPASWSLVIGDALNNLRSALDHAAWHLANQYPLPPKADPNAIQFPFYDTAAKFDQNVERRLPNVKPWVIDYIRTLQQFPPNHPLQDALGFLIDQNNLDKHRNIRPVLGMSVGEMRFEAVHPVNFTVTRVQPSPNQSGYLIFEEETELVSVVGTSVSGEPDVQVKIEGAFAPAFENGVPVVEGLEQMHDAVSIVLNKIEALP